MRRVFWGLGIAFLMVAADPGLAGIEDAALSALTHAIPEARLHRLVDLEHTLLAAPSPVSLQPEEVLPYEEPDGDGEPAPVDSAL